MNLIKATVPWKTIKKSDASSDFSPSSGFSSGPSEKFEQKITHVETGLHLKKNNNKINYILSKVYDELMSNELCRDQHVFPYVLQKNNLNVNEYKILDDFSKNLPWRSA